MAQTIFDRLRAYETGDRSLHSLIAEACDAGDLLVAASKTFMGIVAERPKLQDDDEIWAAFSQAAAAVHRAYADNGHTPDNGKAAA